MKKRETIIVYWLVDTEVGVELWTAEAEVRDNGFFKIDSTSRKIKDFSDRAFAEKEIAKLIKLCEA